MLTIDGSHGEGGGQLVRNAVAFAALTARAVRIERVRAGRQRPGLAAQHLTAARAVAALCGGTLEGDAPGSPELAFRPGAQVAAGEYAFDVGEARLGGSAGSATLVLQTVLLPLMLARGASRVSVRGGTHVPWSPPAEWLSEVWLPALARIGLVARVELRRSGWYPAGGGELVASVAGLAPERGGPDALTLLERGERVFVSGLALAAQLPAHVPQRMADRARSLLAAEGLRAQIDTELAPADSPGGALFLCLESEHARAGFGALGRRGKPAERIAEEAVSALLVHLRSGAPIDAHLADQLVAPLALARACSEMLVERPTSHLATAAWLAERFELARISIAPTPAGPAFVRVDPIAAEPAPAA